jgi:hypothetical protein
MTQAPTTSPRFNNPASQAERALAVEQERLARLTNTRVAYGDVVDPPATGRWAKPQQNPDPSRLYPRLPEGNSQWGGPQVPEEPPLGYSVNDLEPVGELHELAAGAAVVLPTAPMPTTIRLRRRLRRALP